VICGIVRQQVAQDVGDDVAGMIIAGLNYAVWNGA
jgi:hypothetical protein